MRRPISGIDNVKFCAWLAMADVMAITIPEVPIAIQAKILRASSPIYWVYERCHSSWPRKQEINKTEDALLLRLFQLYGFRTVVWPSGLT